MELIENFELNDENKLQDRYRVVVVVVVDMMMVFHENNDHRNHSIDVHYQRENNHSILQMNFELQQL